MRYTKRHLRAFLKYLERFTKTDMTYLARGSFWLTLSYLIQVGSGIVTVVILANVLPKSTFGTYQFVLAMTGIISVCTLSGIHKAIMRAVARGNDGALRAGLRLKLTWNIGIVLASGVVATYYAIKGNVELVTAFVIVGAFAPIIEGFKVYNPFLIGKEAFRDSTLLGIWRKPLPLVAVCTTAFFTNDLIALLFAYFSSSALSYVLVYVSVIRKYRPPLTHDEELLSYSKHMSVITLLGQAAEQADKIIVWKFAGAVNVAAFSIAQLGTKYSGGLLDTVTSLTLPRVAKRDIATLKRSLPRKVWLYVGIMGICSLLYILCAPFVFGLLFPTYSEAIAMTQVLALSLLFVPQSLFNQVFLAHKALRAQYTLSTILPIIKISLMLVLIPTYGMWGVIYAIVATSALSFMLSYYHFVHLPVSDTTA